ncbi:MAG: protein adenylyltransferase SelO family protein, partial [Pseudoxanthomonas sp.]
MRIGFVHGVMNTDNMSILGLTIDYGPYGWIDNYDPDWTPNTTDMQGRRYRFGWQPQVAYWNLSRLAGALSSLFATPEPLQEGLQRYRDVYAAADRTNIAAKLGLSVWREGDTALMERLQTLMQSGEIDMTLMFRALAELDREDPSVDSLGDVFYDPQKRIEVAPRLQAWLREYAARLADDGLDNNASRVLMNAVNPRFVLRNYLVQQVIDRAEQGDMTGIVELLDVMRHPYDEQRGKEAFAAKRPDWARDRAGCSMLSCSS